MVFIPRINYRGIYFVVRKFKLYSKNCVLGTPHDVITSLLIQYINEINKYINPIFIDIFIEIPTLGRLPTKAKDLNPAMRHGYPTQEANLVLHDHGVNLILLLLLY